MTTKLQQYRSYGSFRISLIGDKNYFEISSEDREKIIISLKNGAKFIELGNIFFSASSLSSILPLSNTGSGEVVYEPNKLIEDSSELTEDSSML